MLNVFWHDVHLIGSDRWRPKASCRLSLAGSNHPQPLDYPLKRPKHKEEVATTHEFFGPISGRAIAITDGETRSRREMLAIVMGFGDNRIEWRHRPRGSRPATSEWGARNAMARRP